MGDVLKVVNVNKKFDKDYVLRNISFDLKEGEILGLVGPNGAGKTTLMRIIVGLIKKHGGDIFFCVDKNKIKRDEKLLGCMIETPKFYSYMNAYQNLKFFSGLSGKVDRKEINNMLSFVGLSGETKKKVKKYSLGMKQRLGMALAFLNHPKILILDEPTNGIDPDGIKKIRDYLKKLAEQENVSVLISGHILAEIEKVCDRVVILKKGKVTEIVDMKEKNFDDKIFAFETDEMDEFMDLLKQKNIVIEDIKNNLIKVRLQKENLMKFIKDLVLKDINFYSVYEVKNDLEQKFLNSTGGDANV